MIFGWDEIIIPKLWMRWDNHPEIVDDFCGNCGWDNHEIVDDLIHNFDWRLNNSLQHTRTHCNTRVKKNYSVSLKKKTDAGGVPHPQFRVAPVQPTETHCNTMQHSWFEKKNRHWMSIWSTILSGTFTTHCSTLQHTAAHCNTLHHTASHCNTLHHQCKNQKNPVHLKKEQTEDEYRVAKTHMVPDLYRSFSAKEPYN